MPDNVNQEPLANNKVVPSALNDAQEDALRDGLNAQSVTTVGAHFDAAVMGKLHSGADFRPWHKQAQTRLLWMALPMLCSFLLATLYLQRLSRDLPVPQSAGAASEAMPKAEMADSGVQQTPPLPPMPTALIHHYRMPDIVEADWTRRDYPIVSKIRAFPPPGESPTGKTNSTTGNGEAGK